MESLKIIKGDKRILDDVDCFETVLKAANEAKERTNDLQEQGFALPKIATRVSEVLGVEEEID